MKTFFIIAGEVSGDLLGAKLIAELKKSLSQECSQSGEEVKFVGVGGKLMKEQGFTSIFPMEELSIMGFLEVVPHIPKLLRRINQTAKAITDLNPDCVITIDSPDFCFRVMKKLKSEIETINCRKLPSLCNGFKISKPYQANFKKVHLIAPSVWAYRQGRAKKIAALYDLLLAILPFEPPYFEKHNLKTVFIGHPVVENAPDFSKKDQINSEFRNKYKISSDDILICVTAGSRNGEVKRIFPEFIDAINLLLKKKSNIKVIIPLVDKTRDLVTQMAKSLKVDYFLIEKDEKEAGFFAANFALAKSGTNTVEFSLFRLPMLIAYKINLITYFLVKMVIKIKFANLINLISNKAVIPEMLQNDCDGEKIAKKLEELIEDKNLAEQQIKESQSALKVMGYESPEKSSKKAANEILNIL